MIGSGATAQALIRQARQRFDLAGLTDPASDARFLICGLLGWSATDLLVKGNDTIPEPMRDVIERAILRRLAREPVHRILGQRGFYGLDLTLSAATLEPRPDTEVLVDAALPHLRRMIASKGQAEILDLGTGTGAIALALLSVCPQARALGVDLSAGALETARENAARHGMGDRFSTVQGSWFDNVSGKYDLILSNPPYISTEIVETLAPEVVQYDPVLALDGGKDGLSAYRQIASQADNHLQADGVLGVEIGYDQRISVTEAFENAGYILIEAVRDYGGCDRALLFRRPV